MEQELSQLFGRAARLVEDRIFKNPIRDREIHRDVAVVYAA
jgi:hypothetical protein